MPPKPKAELTEKQIREIIRQEIQRLLPKEYAREQLAQEQQELETKTGSS